MIAAFVHLRDIFASFCFVSFSYFRNFFGYFSSHSSAHFINVFPSFLWRSLVVSVEYLGSVSKWTLIAVIIVIVNVNVMRAVFTFNPIRIVNMRCTHTHKFIHNILVWHCRAINFVLLLFVFRSSFFSSYLHWKVARIQFSTLFLCFV